MRLNRGIVFEAAANAIGWQLRSILAMLGIAVGAAAVIAIMHIGHNARGVALERLLRLGPDLMNVSVRRQGTIGPSIPEAFIDRLPELGIGVRQTVPLIQMSSVVGGRTPTSVTLLAATEGLFDITKATLRSGRFSSPSDGQNLFAVVGAEVADELGKDATEPLRPGAEIVIEKRVVTIIGILDPAHSSIALGFSLDNAIVMLVDAGRRLMGGAGVSSFAARLDPGVDEATVASRVQELTESLLPPGTQVHVDAAWQLLESLDQQLLVYDHLLLSVGAIALLVGGIGIMNVMLMNVSERRQEIGIRLAVGARRADIRLGFFVEALCMASIGTLLGVVFGTLGAWTYVVMVDWPFMPSPNALPAGVFMAVLFALFFGSYPAHRAARLTPIEALRTVA
jgi:putative ABC transport system permease protein